MNEETLLGIFGVADMTELPRRVMEVVTARW